MVKTHGNTKFSYSVLRDRVRDSSSYLDLFRKLGYADLPNLQVRRKIKVFIEDEGIDISHFQTRDITIPVRKRSREELEEAVSNSQSYTDTLRRLGLGIAGCNMKSLRTAIRQNGISVDHFEVDFSKKNSAMATATSREDVLENWEKLLSGERRKDLKSATLLALMKYDGRAYECTECGVEEWRGNTIRLHVDHIDGDRLNNTRENLRFLCPNCHSQTDTFGARKRWK